MSDILNGDDQAASVTLPDGRVVRNLSAVEYDATYAEGTPHYAFVPDTDEPGVAQ